MNSYLTPEELYKLECVANEKEMEKQKSQSSSFFKIPIFQPTAAAAMMYNMQNATIKQKQIIETEREYTRSQSMDVSNIKVETDKISQKSLDFLPASNLKQKEGADDVLLNKQKIFPYICHQCKRDVWTCDIQTQTINSLLNLNENEKIVYARRNGDDDQHKANNNTQTSHYRSKSNANSGLLTATNVYNLNECNNNNSQQFKLNTNEAQPWTDFNVNSVNY